MHQTQSAVLQPSRKAVAGLIMSGSLRKGLRGRQGQHGVHRPFGQVSMAYKTDPALFL